MRPYSEWIRKFAQKCDLPSSCKQVPPFDGALSRRHLLASAFILSSNSNIVIANKLHRVDLTTVNDGKVLASDIVRNPYTNQIDLQEHRSERLMVNGIQGFGITTLYFLVDSSGGEIAVNYDSIKGGKLSQKVSSNRLISRFKHQRKSHHI